MSTFSESLNALDRGIGRSLKVDTVACGKHNEGFNSSLKTFKVPDKFSVMVADGEKLGHIVTVEISSGQVYRGKLIEGAFSNHTEDNMNCQLKDITVTARDGRVSHLDQVYIRGSHVRYFIVPDMLRYVTPLLTMRLKKSERARILEKRLADVFGIRNAPMFRARGVKGRGVGLARGRATVGRARASTGRGR
ncbi:small nuclear ribonucleoprotein Sm D3 [Sphaceloma murrayae]|uniref:Small nuclear ribonucleoprotein Sm D3 n=1 Tax=Sphaceloma murrayae TaxID=2082308 RepID=A0A2K1QVF8_9PEZI|nr:small nuclear ribonucleoprotein Sm D3 [Sphaceloma murrayae]